MFMNVQIGMVECDKMSIAQLMFGKSQKRNNLAQHSRWF